MSDFEKNITSEYLRNVAAQAQDVKQLSYALMNIGNCQRVLDVGCGPGIDTIPLAEQICENGKVYGVDNSEQMIREADAYARNEGVFDKTEHILANVLELPFADDYFDAVKAERLFQVLPTDIYPPKDVFLEISRTVRNNGQLVIADTDWGTASVDFPDIHLERKLTRFFADICRPNGYSARQLYAFFKQSGYKNIRVQVMPQIMYDIKQSPLGTWLTEEALNKDIINPDEAEKWMNILSEKTMHREMFAMVNMIVVSGSK